MRAIRLVLKPSKIFIESASNGIVLEVLCVDRLGTPPWLNRNIPRATLKSLKQLPLLKICEYADKQSLSTSVSSP